MLIFTDIYGGPLKNRYVLEQFHFHWGDTDDCGSEHTINNCPYSAEVCVCVCVIYFPLMMSFFSRIRLLRFS